MTSIRKKIVDKTIINKALNWIDGALCKIIDSGEIPYIEIGIQTEKRLMQEKYHAMIGDINRQAVIKAPGVVVDMRTYDAEACKALLVGWFENEKALLGEPLKKPGRTVIDPISKREITIRASSKEFSHDEDRDFIEWLYSLGADCKVVWTDPKTKQQQSYPEAK